jgi:predicted MFS family arabinose efflux permease
VFCSHFLVSLRLSRLSGRLGHRWLLVIGALLYGFYPVLLGLARDATLYWVASLTGGGVYAIVTASLVNRLMEKAPGTDRPAFMALHNLALNLGMLSGSLMGR